MSPDTQSASLRRFLLGTASDEEAEAFSHLVLTDDNVLLQALADEDELFDEYARDEMSDAEARRFEAVVLQHSEGRRRLSFARDLARRADQATASSSTAVNHTRPLSGARTDPSDDDSSQDTTVGRRPWHRFWGALWTPAARPAWILACTLLLVTALWQARQLSSTAPSAEGPAVAETGAATGPAEEATTPEDPAGSADLSAKVEQLRREKVTLEEQLSAAESQLAELKTTVGRAVREQAVAAAKESISFLLTAATRGSRVPDFKVPQETKRVELEVDLSDARRVDRVDARLFDDRGFQVWGRPGVPTEGEDLPAVRLTVPAEGLDTGSYTLRLEEASAAGRRDDGEVGEIAQFGFRIERN